jgi:hypothetical protein
VVWLVAAALFALGLWAYAPAEGIESLIQPSTRKAIDDSLAPITRLLPASAAGWTFQVLVVLTTLLAAVWSYVKPARGVRPLMVAGGALSAVLVISMIRSAGPRSPDIWPVLLGGLFFLYLWWLATLILDLTIVWHSYVRWSAGINSMRSMMVPGWTPASSSDKARKRTMADDIRRRPGGRS